MPNKIPPQAMPDRGPDRDPEEQAIDGSSSEGAGRAVAAQELEPDALSKARAANPEACDQAQSLVRQFAASQAGGKALKVEERRSLREHCQSCSVCDAYFESIVATLARLGRDRRLTRIAHERDVRRQKLRQNVFDAQDPTQQRTGRWRAFVYPALIAFLLVALGKRVLQPVGAEVSAQGPEVWVRGHLLEPDHGVGTLRRGERLLLGKGGQAELRVGQSLWTIGEHSEVSVQSFKPATVRLESGQANAFGAFECVTPFAFLSSADETRLTLRVDSSATYVDVLQGHVRISTSSGEATVGANETWNSLAGPEMP